VKKAVLWVPIILLLFLYKSVFAAGTMTDLGTFGGPGSHAVGINGTGQVVGSADVNFFEPPHAFLYSGGTMTDLDALLGGIGSYANDINDAGQVVGMVEEGPNEHHGFLYSGGTITDLGFYLGTSGINNAGQVVGDAQASSGEQRAFLYSNGTMTDLGTLGGSTSAASDINDAGQVVGAAHTSSAVWRAFLYSNGTMTDLGTLGGSSSAATGINNAGQVVGWAETSSGEQRAFLYSNGTMTDLGTLGGSYSAATDINDAGQVVGYSETSSGAQWAFLYTPDTPPPPPPPSASLQVLAPNGGDILYKGTDYRIKWSWSNYTGNIRIHVYKDDILHAPVSNDMPVTNGTDGVIFNPPTSWPSGDKYQIRISTIDNKAESKSGYFSIKDLLADHFTWPVDPQNTSNGRVGKCNDWGKDPQGCYWLSDTSTVASSVWRDVQPFQVHYYKLMKGYHLGADYNIGSSNTDRGKYIYPTSKGEILEVLENVCGWGNIIFVRHDPSFGTYTSMYAHVEWLDGKKQVKGASVDSTVPFAKIGIGAWDCGKNNKGSYPAHLHFEIREGVSVVPGRAYTSSIVEKGQQGQIDPNAFISNHN